jgi:hypothetical protein
MTPLADHSTNVTSAAPEPEGPGQPVAHSSTGAAPGARRQWPLWLRAVLAAALLASAALWVLDEHALAQGPVLLSVTRSHGVDLRDLLAAPLLVAATALLTPRRMIGRR